MGKRFETNVRDLKFTLSPLSSEQMKTLGQVMVDTKSDRIARGINSQDSKAKALIDKYARRKLLRNRAPIRDWRWSGAMMGSFKVKVADQDHVTIGFTNARANDEATINRRREEMLADSPKDTETLHAALRATLQQTKSSRVIVLGGNQQDWQRFLKRA
jgi:hypothetical protein